MAQHASLLIESCSELLTIRGASLKPKTGKALGGLGLIKDGAVAVSGEKIIWVGDTSDVRKHVRITKETETIDGRDMVIMPGFVDPHTHPVFAGSREDEWLERLAGRDYLDILNGGGGILSTVRETRKAKKQELVRSAARHLSGMFANGTTTIEAKSGYGLTIKDEVKLLECMVALESIQPIEIVRTFLGAHAVPKEFSSSKSYARFVADAMIPDIAHSGLAEFCDVFCEEGAFSAHEAQLILESGIAHGMKPKMHTNQFNDIGGVKAADIVRPRSLDHLDVLSKTNMAQLKRIGSIAVLLPGGAFFIGRESYPDVKSLISAGVPVALGTDFNPGTCFCYSMPFIMSLACIKLGMNAEQAINCATINAAHAIDRGNTIGSIEAGKQADIIAFGVDTYESIPYSGATNQIEVRIKKGRIV
jgi:imidazolonepropionase